MTETHTPVEESTTSTMQPGDLARKLIACRERAGFDIDQAAVEMHLSPNILRALEKEDFAHLPEPPYVRGYLRGYAKLADQDAKDLIRTYEILRGASPDDTAQHFAPSRGINKMAQPSLSPTTLKFIAFGSAVLVVGLISMIPGVRHWATQTWQDFSAQTNPPEMPRPPSTMDTFAARKAAEEKAAAEALAKVTAQQQAAAAAQLVANNSTEPTASATTSPAPITDASPSNQATDAPTPTSPVNSTTSTQDTATPAVDSTAIAVTPTVDKPAETPASPPPAAPATETTNAAATPTAPATETTNAAATPTAPTTETTNAAATTTTTPPTDTTTTQTASGTPTTTTDPAAATPLPPIVGEATIKMEFSDEVWVQVKGADKKTVFESLNTNGTTKEFKATPPLSFKIGNAPGAKIYINGQLYDQSPYTKGSVARFKIE